MRASVSRIGKVSGTAALSLFLLLAPVARAESCCKGIEYSQTPLQQATQADVVVIGKVTDLEADLSMIEQYKGSGPIAHMVATVRIEEPLLGAKGLTHVRIGFIPSTRMAFSDDAQFNARLNGVRTWRGPINLATGQEACFFLQKHPTGDFYTLMQYANPLNKGELNYETEVKSVRNLLKAYEKPLEALKSKDAAERQLAACALVTRYRTQRPSNTPVTLTNEPIAAEESKLILQALSEMKWGELPFDASGTFSIQSVFYQLNITPKDGWQQPQQKENEDFNVTMEKATSKWFKENASKFQVQRLVANPAAKGQ